MNELQTGEGPMERQFKELHYLKKRIVFLYMCYCTC